MLTATAGLRHKECYDDDLELAPVRLIGGFICVDTHVGCVGCTYCLNRRYPAQRRVLEEKVHLDFADAGVPTERIVSWICGLPSYRQAHVPVRIGHATDLAFEEAGACAVIEGLDPGHPVVLASRFPIGAAARQLLRARLNVMVHLTVPPPSAGADDVCAARRALDSVRDLPAERVFVMFCPLVAGAAASVRELLRDLPAGVSVGFKEIDVTAIPGCSAFAPMERGEIDHLIAQARQLGHRWLPFFGCQVRTNLGLPCFFFPKAQARAPETCTACPNLSVCTGVRLPSLAQVREGVAALGLLPTSARFVGTRVEVEVGEAAARADETFLSELLKVEVHLSSVARAQKRETVRLSEDVFRRWQRVGFYPVDELRSVGRRMAEMARR